MVYKAQRTTPTTGEVKGPSSIIDAALYSKVIWTGAVHTASTVFDKIGASDLLTILNDVAKNGSQIVIIADVRKASEHHEFTISEKASHIKVIDAKNEDRIATKQDIEALLTTGSKEQVQAYLNQFPANSTVLFLCGVGKRSQDTVDLINSETKKRGIPLPFTPVNITGGFRAILDYAQKNNVKLNTHFAGTAIPDSVQPSSAATARNRILTIIGRLSNAVRSAFRR